MWLSGIYWLCLWYSTGLASHFLPAVCRSSLFQSQCKKSWDTWKLASYDLCRAMHESWHRTRYDLEKRLGIEQPYEEGDISLGHCNERGEYIPMKAEM